MVKKHSSPGQLDFPFASLDFPGRSTLYPHEIEERLGISRKHFDNLVEENLMPAIDIAGDHEAPNRANQRRRYWRVPIESYRQFILTRISGPLRKDLLKTLPEKTLRDLHHELTEILKL